MLSNDKSELIPYGGIVCSVYVAGGQALNPIDIPALDRTRDLTRIAAHYRDGGADRMFLDVQDSWDEQDVLFESVRAMAAVGPPLWVSVDHGTIRSVSQVRALLEAGARAVSVNTAAVDDPELVGEAVAECGSSHVVGVVNGSARPDGGWEVCVEGGQRRTGIEIGEWSVRLAAIGVGALIVNDIDRSYAGRGYNLPLVRTVAEAVSIPVIACGGSGKPEHLPPALTEAGATGVFVYSMIYSGRHTFDELVSVLRPLRSRGGAQPG